MPSKKAPSTAESAVSKMTPEEIDKMPAKEAPKPMTVNERNELRIKGVLSGDLKAARIKISGSPESLKQQEKQIESRGVSISHRGPGFVDIIKGAGKAKQHDTEEGDPA